MPCWTQVGFKLGHLLKGLSPCRKGRRSRPHPAAEPKASSFLQPEESGEGKSRGRGPLEAEKRVA